jgi:hypothetical protein
MYASVTNNLNWLAQCQKRRYYPIDRSDRSGLTAFEYGWKSFNNLYSEFSIKPDRKKMDLCIEKYINPSDYFERNKRDLYKFCDIDHKVYLENDQYENLNPKLSEEVKRMRHAIQNEDCSYTIKCLLDCLYRVRNARVHGAIGTGDVSFAFLPKAIFTLNIAILCSKLNVSEDSLGIEIDNKINKIRHGY